MSGEYSHDAVLLNEAITALNVKANGYYFDGTFGRGGHTGLIVRQLGPKGRLLAVDRDEQAVAVGRSRYEDDSRVEIRHLSFSRLVDVLEGPNPQLDGVILDLGVSSPQLDDATRGFSFMRDGKLDMRMDASSGLSAQEWLASVEEAELTNVLWRYGEERFSRRIAKAIVARREKSPITSTLDLAEVIQSAVPKHTAGKHPATRSFQAIRIEINQELVELEQCLNAVLEVLRPGGRLVVISFHSLEDRMVKQFMREHSKPSPLPRHLPVVAKEQVMPLKVVGKAIKAGPEELEKNPRARSAVLRVAEKQSE